MMLRVPGILSAEQVAECRRLLDAADWADGKTTVGEQGARVKRNRQLPELSPLGRQLGEMILTALARNPLFFSAALPLKTVPPLFNRYEGGEHYGTHIDGAVRAVPAAPISSARTCPPRCSSAIRPTTTAASSWSRTRTARMRSNYPRAISCCMTPAACIA